jgi:hypothetical protein
MLARAAHRSQVADYFALMNKKMDGDIKKIQNCGGRGSKDKCFRGATRTPGCLPTRLYTVCVENFGFCLQLYPPCLIFEPRG